jgi:hypothetical protein
LQTPVEATERSATLPKVVQGAISLFWLVFFADAILSLTDEIASLAGDFPSLSVMRSAVALVVLGGSIAMAALVGLTPRAPKRTLVPLILFTWWAGPAMAFPLAFWNMPHLALGLAVAQVWLAMTLWYVFRDGRGGRPFPLNEAPAFSWRYLLLAEPATLLLSLVLVVVSTLLGLSTQLELLTGGYVRVRPDGIYLVERKFQSGDREVRLTGMMHVASREFYANLLTGIDPAVPSVVLVEGVTDRRRLLGGKTLSYERVAKFLNVTPQSKSVFSQQIAKGLGEGESQGRDDAQVSRRSPGREVDFRHADVDVESFHPQTIAFILAVMGLFQSADLHQFASTLADPSSPITNESAQAQVMDDILFARNRRLTAEIESSLKVYRRVIVPWGAMHLPEIESWLETRNFVESDEVERKALGFW